jgi:sigma-B regulation protein RsbU (phosphoserine phosphatase)
VLGVLPDWKYRNNRLQLGSGDKLVLFTDGVTEAEDAYGTEFGEERVLQALRDGAGRSAEEVRRILMDAVTGYCGVASAMMPRWSCLRCSDTTRGRRG